MVAFVRELALVGALVAFGAGLSGCSDVPGGRFDATAPIFTAEDPNSLSVELHKQFNLPQTTTDHQVDLNQLLAFELQRYASSDPVQWKFVADKFPTDGYVVATGDLHPTLYVGPSARNLDPLIAAVGANGQNIAIRNDVVSTLLSASRGNCYAYVKSLRADQVGSRLLSDFFAGSLATAGSLVTHAQAAHILAGLAGFSTGEGASIDRNVFAQQAAEAIGDAMLKLQDDDRTLIESKMQQSYQSWPLGLALADVMQFHGDCSVARGLTKLQGALQQRETAVQAVRAAAAQSELNHDTANAMLQVVAAIESPVPAPAPGPSLQAAAAWKQDLDDLQTDVLTCMKGEAEAIQTTPQAISTATPDFLGGGKCKSTKSQPIDDWLNFQALATGLIDSTSAPPPPAAGVPPKSFLDAATAWFNGAEQNYQSASNAQIAARATTRAALATALGAWSGQGAPDDVVAFIRVFAGLPPAPSGALSTFSPAIAASEIDGLDPVIAYEIAAAELAKNDAHPTAALAAAEALQAGLARYNNAASAG